MASSSLNSPKLSLDLKQTEIPKSFNVFLKEGLLIGNDLERKSKLCEYVNGLEGEMMKIEVFKRELPLCRVLMRDAVETLKEEITKCKRKIDEAENAKLEIDKKDWMSSVQLWSANGSDANTNSNSTQKQNSALRIGEGHRPIISNPFPSSCTYWNREGAFVPFKSISSALVSNKKKEIEEDESDSELSLSVPCNTPPPPPIAVDVPLCLKNRPSFMTKELPNTQMTVMTPMTHIQMTPRPASPKKMRRCWSPELHRRFVNALQQLGGPQVATPKQIRELMKVDGLTNDEVKSHLQKYRIHHIKKTPSGSAGGNQPVLMAGVSWEPEHHRCEVKSKTTSPDGPLQLARSTTGGHSMEDEEDRKSETYSWNCHSHKSGESED